MQLVLASASPRRRMLLEQLGLSFTVDPSSLPEQVDEPLAPAELARRLALTKAREVAGRHPDALVIGADTVVVVGGQALGKPQDAAEAAIMLTQLAGRRHQVITGVALVHGASERELVEHEGTVVWIRPVSREQVAAYAASGEPLDKAGGYAIQGLGAVLVKRINGCYYNVVGLPLSRLAHMLEGFGVHILK